MLKWSPSDTQTMMQPCLPECDLLHITPVLPPQRIRGGAASSRNGFRSTSGRGAKQVPPVCVAQSQKRNSQEESTGVSIIKIGTTDVYFIIFWKDEVDPFSIRFLFINKLLLQKEHPTTLLLVVCQGHLTPPIRDLERPSRTVGLQHGQSTLTGNYLWTGL